MSAPSPTAAPATPASPSAKPPLRPRSRSRSRSRSGSRSPSRPFSPRQHLPRTRPAPPVSPDRVFKALRTARPVSPSAPGAAATARSVLSDAPPPVHAPTPLPPAANAANAATAANGAGAAAGAGAAGPSAPAAPPGDRVPRRSRSPSPRVSQPTRRDVRRVWNRAALVKSGISDALLAALDTFTENVPRIPTTKDLSRKIPIRNMRKWIADLETPAYAPLWDRLVAALRDDRSVQNAWGDLWDHDLCRFILGVLVSEDQTKNRADKKQSRQAVNNAIKRELTCPIESGSSSRSKTFRDLFREKCSAGGVAVPKLVFEAPTKSTRASSLPHPTLSTPTPPSSNAMALTTTTTETPWYENDQYVPPHGQTVPALFHHVKRRKLSDRSAVNMLARFRDACGLDEWGRAAWWQLTSNQAVKDLSFLLAAHSLFELRTLLLDFRWIRRTFECADFDQGMRQIATDGYDLLLEKARLDSSRFPAVDIEAFRLIRNSLMVIIPILAKDSIVDPKDETFVAHLATQLVGRLLNLKRRFANIASLIQSIELHAPRPWLRPLNPCFQEPRTDIKIAVPSNGTFTPHLIVLSQDGSLLAASGTRKSTKEMIIKDTEESTTTKVSSSNAKAKSRTQGRKVSSIRIWHVESGKCVCLVDNIFSLVRCLALARDHRCIIAETVDGLFFWKLEKHGDEYKIASKMEASPRPKSVTSITPTVGSHGVLTTSRSDSDPVITLWDTKTGKRVKSFSKVTSKATCTDVSLDQEYFASGHNNAFIHLWNLGSGDGEPVLSFKNEGDLAENGQQNVVLRKVNNTQDDMRVKTISISFYETGQESWLAAVSADEVIRVWGLPPRSMTREGRSWVSSIRTAVLKCARVRQVEWSRWGWIFSAGDDGIARMWRRKESGSWEAHAIGREKRERGSDISSVLVSSGKGSSLVATYVTKSPYVTVWDMSGFVGEEGDVKRRGELYRSYLCMVRGSVDASDIRHLTALEKTRVSGGGGGKVVGMGMGNGTGLEGMGAYGFGDNVKLIREELEGKFDKLDIKNATKPVDDMHPRLIMKPEEWARRLEVCFEQPVIYGVSGRFKTRAGVEGGEDGAWWEKGRRGMVAALQDGAVGIFELEEKKGGVEKMEVEGGAGRSGAEGKGEVKREEEREETGKEGGREGGEQEGMGRTGEVAVGKVKGRRGAVGSAMASAVAGAGVGAGMMDVVEVEHC